MTNEELIAARAIIERRIQDAKRRLVDLALMPGSMSFGARQIRREIRDLEEALAAMPQVPGSE